MSGRYRTVALQAVGVAVLAAFIFVAFLRPSEPGDLSGIDAPGSGDSPTVIAPPDVGDKKGERNRGDDQGKKGDSNGSGSNGSGAPRSSGSDDADDSSTQPDTGPGDDQYTDLVTVLMKQVGEPGLFKEIDGP